MDAEKVLVIKKIRQYLNELKEHNITVEKVYLYGSYAKGNYHGFSDIDIAIVSKDFEGRWFADRDRIVPLRRNIDVRIEPMPYRPEDFTDSDPLAVEAMANGEEIEIRFPDKKD
ncbi:MAG: nucleotidyltransferase domain-containing protein [Dehalococcoidia bacterium]|nr:hypothetical protein [Chloroflexota bacterium]